jgi:hypothetical protein
MTSEKSRLSIPVLLQEYEGVIFSVKHHQAHLPVLQLRTSLLSIKRGEKKLM